MGNVIKILEQETGKTCFDTYRRCLDHERASLIEYDEFSHEFMKEQGETERFSGPRNIQHIAMDWQNREPAFPLRIAFDNWAGRNNYVRAISLAKDNGIRQMSNYLLYNFRDKPLDLYRRLLINIDLCDALDVNIYSFPMKYHPIMDEKWFTNRDYIDLPHWSRKAIRTVQAILNSTHGKIGRGRTFFCKAFGRSEEELLNLIQMPEAFIIKRWDAELNGLTSEWRNAYRKLTTQERDFADRIISTNEFDESMWEGESPNVDKLLRFYLIKREDIPLAREAAKLYCPH